ncbi:MAG: alpha/beta hydrolase [Candidatus Liptonbacteria bacterium]|nr:alpha/beta hydrolase [Candidatus Liptonbacteria bacterium]
MNEITEKNLANAVGVLVTIRSIAVDGYEINYAVAGSGPALLLLHGGNFGWGMWYPNIAEFAKRFTVYAMDLPGAGRSSPVDYRHLNPEKDFTQTALHFIRALGLSSVSVIGHSIGAWAALRLASGGGSEVRKLVLADPVGFSTHAGFPEKVLGMYPFALFLGNTVLRPRRGNKNLERFLRSAFYNAALPLTPEFVDYFYETMKRSHGIRLISRLIALRRDFFLPDALAYVRERALIIWGENDATLPFKNTVLFRNPVPGIRVEVFPMTGHVPSLEQKERFNTIAMQFLS